MSLAFDFEIVFYDHDIRRDNFTVQLLRLIAKADPMNLARIKMGFPNEVKVCSEWMKTDPMPDRDELPLFIAKVLNPDVLP